MPAMKLAGFIYSNKLITFYDNRLISISEMISAGTEGKLYLVIAYLIQAANIRIMNDVDPTLGN